MSRGIVVYAQNSSDTDYVKCAAVLAASAKRVMPIIPIAVITDSRIADEYAGCFDYVIPLPQGDTSTGAEWKLCNDWQVYEASPFDETIKVEADIFLPCSIEHWWGVCSQQDIVISTSIRDYQGSISDSRHYRRFIDDNVLPDCYNALTYFKKSATAEKFFDTVRCLFEDWEQFKTTLKCNPSEPATTDWVYAIAAHVIGVEKTTLPVFTEMSMVHMKQYINHLPTEKWTDSLVYEPLPDAFRIQTVPQMHPVHYHVKEFADVLWGAYGKR